mmetsp:Transcript_16562/g.49569  ORF Transcript_16562/g.49569 Transcript_16562/m.49569 type:complete len:94 (-) Transcript_16562:913-1194(-)
MTQTWSIDMLLAELQGFKHGREHATASSGATQRSKATSVHCTWRAASPSPSPPPPSPGRGTQQRTVIVTTRLAAILDTECHCTTGVAISSLLS